MERIYFDNAATTPLDERVVDEMAALMRTHFGNPSSIHAEGRQSRTFIEQARRTVAQHLNASIGEIFFTSGGTEANNMALKCAVRDLGVERIISSPTEHHCGLHTFERLEKDTSVEIVYLSISPLGHPDLDQLRELLSTSKEKTLVSLMHSNNEIGTMINLGEVSSICREHGAYFHSDTVQTMGYFPIDVEATPVSFLSGAAHKFYGPKGVGFIYVNADNLIQPYMDGGAQERNMRGGTENIYGIVGMAKALDLAIEERSERETAIRAVRDYLKAQIAEHLPMATYNGDVDNGHYKVLNMAFPASPMSELLLLNLDIHGISVSGGSACSSGSDTGSHVIRALKGPDDTAANIRVSFSHHNTKEEVEKLVGALREILVP